MITLLVLANAGFYAWTHGHLSALGFAPSEQREPERLQAQIQPETMHLLNAPEPQKPASEPAAEPPAPATTPAEAARAAPAGPTAPTTPPAPAVPTEPLLPPTSCWYAKGFTTAQIEPLEKRLLDLALPKGSWRIQEVRSGGRWVVYMGRYNDELMDKKKEELKELKVEFRTLNDPPLGPGLALGTFSTEAAAEQGLSNVARKGVRSARVAKDREETVTHTLRLSEITAEEREAVLRLGPEFLAGKSLQPCG
ncbi:SPOR domain-containing protein [Hydrogenophaga crassostreae]|uniref:SPOR domain-containing protein n=1 Tax=Hydrogenophaga crassostreae TaxID=1763535 RepID=UPI0012F71FCD|nr:SPOR domain-containing protein [Hydrogenophaga crassostreae]